MSTFEVGMRVVVTVPGTHAPFGATITRVVVPTGAIGGLFVVAADDGRRFAEGADWMAGDWMAPMDSGAVYAHPDALVVIGGAA